MIMDHFFRERCFSEVIMEDSPARVHFDADLPLKKEGKWIDLGFSRYEYLQAVCQFMTDLMKEYFGVDVALGDFHTPEACTTEKLSYHILLPYNFKDLAARQNFKKCVENAKSLLKVDDSIYYQVMKINSALDSSIYSISRVFRLHGCCKEGKKNH